VQALSTMLGPLGPFTDPEAREGEEEAWAAAAAADPSAIAILVDLARDPPDPAELGRVSTDAFQAELAHLLGLVGAAAPEAVVPAIGELIAAPGARATAIEVLGAIGHPDGLRWLAPLVDSELSDDEATWLASSLGDIATPEARILLDRLRARTPPERTAVLREIDIALDNLARRR
jgi:hypothetical protein